MDNLSIKIFKHTDELYQDIWQLREDVLRIPLGLSLKNEDLSMDKEDLIFAAVHNDKVVGCLMLHPVTKEEIKFRQMAVAQDVQKLGVGRRLMQVAEQIAQQQGYNKITLHARMVAHPFYEKLGFITIEGVFIEVGIPHVKMFKNI